MPSKLHWEQVYATKATDAVSWYQPHAERSLRLIRQASGLPMSASIIDVGGGASTLVDDLLAAGYAQLSVLDLAGAALASARQRLGAAADRVQWLEADITTVVLPAAAYDLWHDRAVFHFLTTPEQRRAYQERLLSALKPAGQLIIATFADDGPEKCSGLPVQRYSAEALQAEFAGHFDMLSLEREQHPTPFGTTQHFVYGHFRRRPAVN